MDTDMDRAPRCGGVRGGVLNKQTGSDTTKAADRATRSISTRTLLCTPPARSAWRPRGLAAGRQLGCPPLRRSPRGRVDPPACTGPCRSWRVSCASKAQPPVTEPGLEVREARQCVALSLSPAGDVFRRGHVTPPLSSSSEADRTASGHESRKRRRLGLETVQQLRSPKNEDVDGHQGRGARERMGGKLCIQPRA
jgi:hypothetical protein